MTTVFAVLLTVFPVNGDDEGFVPLFNGKDLSGWSQVNCAAETFTVKDGLIVSTGVPTGVLRTDRMYENYILELEWKHVKKGGNAGLFVHSGALPVMGKPFTRSVEVQIIDRNNPEGTATAHGDVFAIQGATFKPFRPHPKGWMRCLPSERRANPAGQWNHYRVECRDGVVSVAVNGKVVSGGTECNPRKGYICLESEGTECHFRNIRIKELPSSNPPKALIAEADRGFTSIYSGLDFRGWKWDPGHKGHWVAADWRLRYDGKSEAKDKSLWSKKEYGDFVLMADWRFLRKARPNRLPVIQPDGSPKLDDAGKPVTEEVADSGDSGIYLRGSSKSQVNIWCWPVGSGEVYGYRTDKNVSAEVRRGVTPRVRADNKPGQWNRFIITMKGDRLTVVLNGQTVLENAQLPGVNPKGPIALQHHGDPVEFANLYIKELD